MFEAFAVGFGQISFSIVLIIALGVCMGIVFGASPGITVSMGMALCLPITFTMDAITAIAFMAGLYVGGTSGGCITAILLNIPGTPASLATTFDGTPMARNGKAGLALGYSIVASFFGGIVSLVFLMAAAPQLAKITIHFGPTKYFAMTFLSITLIASLVGDSILKGLASGFIGMMLASVGQAPLDMSTRFTLGVKEFAAGFPLLCVLIGVYAISELLKYVEDSHIVNGEVTMKYVFNGFGLKIKDFSGQLWNMIRSTIVGIGIGILPGIGAGTSNIIAYSVAKDSSKYPEKFGTGIKDGILASEAANNAVTGGALIPLLTLGIPGDGATAILLAVLTIYSITPGPLLFETSGDLVNGLFADMLVANVFMLIVMLLGVKVFVKLIQIPKYYLLPGIMVLCIVGAIGQNNRVSDVWAVIIFGTIGFLMCKFGLDLAPMIMGFILGPTMELNFLRGLTYTGDSFLAFFNRPITAVILSIAIIYLVYVSIRNVKKARKHHTTSRS